MNFILITTIISSDVVSFFVNLLAIKTISNRWNFISERWNIPKNECLLAIQFVLESTLRIPFS